MVRLKTTGPVVKEMAGKSLTPTQGIGSEIKEEQLWEW